MLCYAKKLVASITYVHLNLSRETDARRWSSPSYRIRGWSEISCEVGVEVAKVVEFGGASPYGAWSTFWGALYGMGL
jgi:hypothetical protein